MRNGEDRGLVGWGWRILGWNIAGNFSFALQKELRRLCKDHSPSKSTEPRISFTLFVWLPQWNTRISGFKHVFYFHPPSFEKTIFSPWASCWNGWFTLTTNEFLHLALFIYFPLLCKKTYLRVQVTKPQPFRETWGNFFGSLLGSKLRRRVSLEVLSAPFLITPSVWKRSIASQNNISYWWSLYSICQFLIDLMEWLFCMFFCSEHFLSDFWLFFQKSG